MWHSATPPPVGRVWSPARTRDRSHEFNISSQDTLLGGHLNAIDDDYFTDLINHHALPREDRVYLLGNLTDWTPKKRLKKPISVRFNQMWRFPWRQREHEFDPETTGADELVSDEMSLDDEMVATVKHVPENHRH